MEVEKFEEEEEQVEVEKLEEEEEEEEEEEKKRRKNRSPNCPRKRPTWFILKSIIFMVSSRLQARR